MKTFHIVETTVYEVDAEDEGEALEVFLQSEDTNQFFAFVEDREVEEV